MTMPARVVRVDHLLELLKEVDALPIEHDQILQPLLNLPTQLLDLGAFVGLGELRPQFIEVDLAEIDQTLLVGNLSLL